MLKYYAHIKDGKINGCGQCICLTEGVQNIEISQEVYQNISRYIWDGEEVVFNSDWEEEEYKKNRIKEILSRLDEIDLKSIRALRANDTVYLEMYEEEAEALRKELRGLQQ